MNAKQTPSENIERENIKLILLDWEGFISEPGGGRIPWNTPAIAELSDLVNKIRESGGPTSSNFSLDLSFIHCYDISVVWETTPITKSLRPVAYSIRF